MKMTERVLPGDVVEAERLDACCIYCLHQAREAYLRGQYKSADLLVKDYENAKRDLDKLVSAMKENDRIKGIAEDLIGKGLHVTIVKNYFLGGQA